MLDNRAIKLYNYYSDFNNRGSSIMKKIFVCILAICLIALTSVSVFAEVETVANLNVSYKTNDNGNIVITASVVDITVDKGLCIIDYDIKYDASALEFVSATVNMPSKWKQFEESEESEILSGLQEDGVYVWAVLNARIGYGVTEDNEFTINIEFKPLASKSTNVNFECQYVLDDDLGKFMAESKSISVESKSSGSSQVPSEDSDVTSEDDNSEVTDNSEASDIISDNSDDSQNNSNDVSEDIAEDASKGEDGEAENALSDEAASSDSSENDSNGDNTAVYIIIAAVAVAIVVGVVVVIKSKKGKK